MSTNISRRDLLGILPTLPLVGLSQPRPVVDDVEEPPLPLSVCMSFHRADVEQTLINVLRPYARFVPHAPSYTDFRVVRTPYTDYRIYVTFIFSHQSDGDVGWIEIDIWGDERITTAPFPSPILDIHRVNTAVGYDAFPTNAGNTFTSLWP